LCDWFVINWPTGRSFRAGKELECRRSVAIDPIVLKGRVLVAIHFTLNGKPATLDVNPDMPLLWALRDNLNMTGTKFGCGMALCGACTVHINGEATRSCITPVSSLTGKRVTTIEGLSPDRSHPVQKAWIEIDVPQCGYCQSGQIMAAAALLAKTPHPTDAQIEDAMSGNICRCGTYNQIRQAIHRAAQLQTGGNKSANWGKDAAPVESADQNVDVLAGGAE
jgi:isoquinoline 1-oxidoreductase subunit alpha